MSIILMQVRLKTFEGSICSLVFPFDFGEEDFGYYADYCSQLKVNDV